MANNQSRASAGRGSCAAREQDVRKHRAVALVELASIDNPSIELVVYEKPWPDLVLGAKDTFVTVQKDANWLDE